jgi:hypothetical protein
MFLKKGSAAVAMSGVALSMPLLAEVAASPSGTEAASNLASSAPDLPEGFQMTEALVAHVRDIGTGEINLFVGQRQVVINDPALARALFHATR